MIYMLLKRGDTGEEVVKLQESLGLNTDGIFGENTEKLVMKFQNQNMLNPDGVVGEKTLKLINKSVFKSVGPVILKKGSINGNVMKLQKYLNIIPDGIFDTRTKEVVELYQSNNHLTIDGVVGPDTWACMGFVIYKNLSLDSDVITTNNNLVINKKYLSSNQYFTGSKPVYIFLHHTAGWYNPYSVRKTWNNDNRGEVTTEFLIGGQSIKGDDFTYDGEVLKVLPDGGWGWHLGIGKNDVHKHSIGIELNNFGFLTKGGYYNDNEWIKKEKDSFYTYVGTKADESQVIQLEKSFRGNKYWHKYSNNQIDSLKKLLEYLSKRNDIDISVGLPELMKKNPYLALEYNSDIRYGNYKTGIFSHTNVDKNKYDVFPQTELVEMLINISK